MGFDPGTRHWRGALAVLLAAGLPASALAQDAGARSAAVGADDYARAARLMKPNAEALVDHAVGAVHWLDDTRFWYRDHDAAGDRYLRVDAATGESAPAFDHDKLARALGQAAGKSLRANALQLNGIAEGEGQDRYEITYKDRRYRCDLSGKGACAPAIAKRKGADGKQADAEPGVRSPDGKREAFVRDWNLWVRDLASGAETQLTRDGVENYGYATDNAGWKHTDRAILVWSPDSRRIATFRQDQRKTGDMVLVATNVGRPKVEKWKYPLVGDRDITMIERVIVDVAGALESPHKDARDLAKGSHHVLRLKMPPDQHRSTLCDDVSCDGGWEDVQWAPDGRTLAFVSSARDHRQVWLRVADAASGAVRTVFDETAKTWFDSGISGVSWRYLPDSREVLWYSRGSGWGQLSLHDLDSGKRKHMVTSGEGNVAEVLRVDPASRTVWFVGVGKEAGRNPYYRHLYKVSLDGGVQTLLSPEDADHAIALSRDGGYFVDTYSTTTQPPVTLLRKAADGATVKEIARADITRLKAAGWVPPEPFTVKARDGRTDLYGLLFKPADFDAGKRYPVVDYVYPGPQAASVRSWGFLPAHGDNQSLAELGFVVVAIDGMGSNPWRSQAFYEAYAGDMGDYTLADQVAGLRELGKRHAWIDLDRVGIWGHSGGGAATAAAMFRYPDFFKVGISESGNHDNRSYEDDWAEKWQGLPRPGKDGASSYDDQANQNHARHLKGHLLLAHGTLDDNVPPYNTLLVVDALIKANKDFDLIMIPNARHGFGDATAYMTRRRWDYFLRHLAGVEPPKNVELKIEAP
ncbi:S9 family peptidase [Luteimonas aquatica]|uniref:S9 family peptidase n=1 Tax=Luteimonas aquatica TaxID=450364 RepID=UPI001F59D1B9|nr:DPP IV N-terminal domain-containing protein [Luteimonas aquatica]